MLIISLVFKSLTTYVQVRFVHMREHSIGKKLVEGYLNQPYTWFLNRNSADLGKTILSEVGIIIGDGIRPLIELIAKSVVTITIVILLIIADPKLALIIGFLLVIIFMFVLDRGATSDRSPVGKLDYAVITPDKVQDGIRGRLPDLAGGTYGGT